jgi:hypothetical protein
MRQVEDELIFRGSNYQTNIAKMLVEEAMGR